MSNMLNVLGASLAKAISAEELACRGLLRLTVMTSVEQLKKESNPRQATIQTIAYVNKMTYQDWKTVIESPLLSQRLANIGIKEPPSIVGQLKQTLIEQQSLFTMAAH
ncbi:MAG: hypothetical protein JXB07_10780 [Anaerolineae bacterium]|nr:hypothetical protein [Anaerolineae bacterium]